MTACFGYKNKDSKRRSLRMKTLSIIFISARCERAVSTCKNAPWSDKGTLSRVRERTPRLLPLDLARKMTRKPLSRRSPYLSWTRRPFTILSNFDRFLSDLTDYFEKRVRVIWSRVKSDWYRSSRCTTVSFKHSELYLILFLQEQAVLLQNLSKIREKPV